MARSLFSTYDRFVRKHYRIVIAVWVIVLIISSLFINRFFSAVSFNVTSQSSLTGTNSESAKTQNILNAQFPSTSNSSTNLIIVVFQGKNIYSDPIKSSIISLNQTISRDPKVANFTGTENIYSIEAQLLDTTVPDFMPQIVILAANITTVNSALYIMQQNLTTLSTQMFQLQQGINGTAQLVYGIPSNFVQVWSAVFASSNSVVFANQQANATIFPQLNGDALSYYNAFFAAWNGTWQTYPNQSSLSLPDRESLSINQTVAALQSSSQTSPALQQFLPVVALGLTVTDWNQESAIANLTINVLASKIPSDQSSLLGSNPDLFLEQLYDLGPSPSNSTLPRLIISFFENALSSNTSGLQLPSNFASIPGFSISQLLTDTYNLGSSPSVASVWNLASSFFANITSSMFSSSPVFTVNSTSLFTLLSSFNGPYLNQVQTRVDNLIASQNYANFPFILSRSVTQNFISQDNSTMLILFNFASKPSSDTINAVKNDVKDSSLPNHGTVYVTGLTVLSADLKNAISPAFMNSAVPGVAVSLMIAGILFLAPAAALIPLVISGFAIGITFPSIYAIVVVLMGSQITFITPILTILVMLGLAVDYSVLQLRRFKEERLSGKSKEESVSISVKWAGQAVLTAGLTIILSFIVMALAKIPAFSGVGYAIAIGVSILLAASLTLLPSLEMMVGDKLFWPSMKARSTKIQKPGEGRLARIARNTIKRKVPIIIVITLIAASAFYVGIYKTPTSGNILKLIPNFDSNKGFVTITNEMGSRFIAPTQIVITTPTPIVNGQDQFNQTLLNQIELISATAAKSSSVASVTSPTRPYGSTFNYSGIANMPIALESQYVNGIVSQIGEDNKTALITVGLTLSPESSQAISALQSIEHNISNLPLIQGISVHYGGTTQQTYDTQSFINTIFPELVIILCAAVYIILFLQLRSAFNPVVLIFTVLCAVAFSLALLSGLFYYLQSLPIYSFIPLFVVVMMLGVGTDYDIFLVTRIREEVLSGKSDVEAIKAAISKAWVTILGLGLILSSVFASLFFSGIGVLQEISLAISSAVLVDVAIIVLFFVPSLMALAQKYNWWPSKAVENRKTDKEVTEKEIEYLNHM